METLTSTINTIEVEKTTLHRPEAFELFFSNFQDMQILNSKASQIADQQTIEKQDISSLELMERAAIRFCEAFHRRFPNPGSGLIICGPGNNGGDGLALARLLHEKGISISVFLPDCFSRFSTDWLANRNRLPKEIPVIQGNSDQFPSAAQDKSWICDGLFGSGFNKNLEGEIQKLVHEMNLCLGLKISIDVPSGLKEEMGVDEIAFLADWTGTFQTPKLAFLLPDTGQWCPEFEVIPIELETDEAQKIGPAFFYLEKKDIQPFFTPRTKFSHKGTYGHGLLLAGSHGKIGAALLATKAMIRSGVGLATVAVPKCGIQSLHSGIPEAMILPDDHDHLLGKFPDLSPYHAIGIGPGIGQNEETSWLLKELIFTSQKPLVLDADALNILAKHPDWIRHLPPKTVLTPHPGEWKRLAGEAKNGKERQDQAIAFAKDHQVILVVKGAHTQICLPNGSVFFNSTGNPGMASGGMGDALTGLITGFLAKGMEPEDAALAAVFLHGLAGDLAAKETGFESLTATDLIQKIGSAFLKLAT